jgi:hypothetical protein
MKHGRLHIALLCVICLVCLVAIGTYAPAATDWGQGIPTASPSALPDDDIPPAPGAVAPSTSSSQPQYSPDTTAPKVQVQCAVQCVEPVQCVQPVRCVQRVHVVRQYQVMPVASAAPAAVGCQRVGILGRLRSRLCQPSRQSACVQTVAGVGCAH